MDCGYIRDGLLEFIGRRLRVSDYRGRCVVTFPMETLDGRFVDVYVEEFGTGDHVEVHDGGKTVSELYAQGIHLTEPKRRRALEETAGRLGARFDSRDDTFKATARASDMYVAILAVAQCASVAMHEVLHHRPAVERMPVPAMVRRTLTRWDTPEFDIQERFRLKGASSGAPHEFDYVATSTRDAATCVAVQVLSTTHRPKVQVRLYGFLVLDIRGTEYDSWPRIAVVSNAGAWSAPLLQQVDEWSAELIAVRAGKAAAAIRALPERIEHLAYTAGER